MSTASGKILENTLSIIMKPLNQANKFSQKHSRDYRLRLTNCSPREPKIKTSDVRFSNLAALSVPR